MAVSNSELIGLYLSYFGRPPDPDGLSYYTSNPEFTIQSVSVGFSASPESQALYGAFGYAQINAIYQNLFNRDAEPDGLTYWYTEVTSGRINPAQAAMAIYLGAQNDDTVSVANKVALCTDFVAQLDTPADIAGYTGNGAAALARMFVHTVDSTDASLTAATAALGTQLAYVTGQSARTFAVTKSAGNIVSFTNPGGLVTATESGGTWTFTSGTGNTGTGTATGTIAGVDAGFGVTVSMTSALAAGRAFTGSGTAHVTASATGENLASVLTATGVDVIQLTSGQNYTLTAAQAAIAKFGAAGTVGALTDAGQISVQEALADAIANSASWKAKGVDLVVGTIAASSDISTLSVAGVDRLDLGAAGLYSMTAAQAAMVVTGTGTQTVTLTNAATGQTMGAGIETVKLANVANAVTMGTVDQVIQGNSADDTVTAITGVTSESDFAGGTNVVVVTAGVDISKGTFLATGGTISYDVDAATTATMTIAQLGEISTAEGTQNITLADKATALMLHEEIETFTLGAFANSVTMGAVTQVVIGGSGADTVTAIADVESSSDLKGGANVVIVLDAMDLSAGAFVATGGTLTFNLDAVTTATLSAAEAANIGSATGTQTIAIANAATGLVLADEVEVFKLGNFTNTMTLGAAVQDVTGGTGTDTLTIGDLAASGVLAGGAGTTDKLSVGGTLGAATISAFEALHVTDDSDISAANAGAALGTTTLTMGNGVDLMMTVAQNEGLKGSATVAGTAQSVTLTAAGTVTAIAGIETYHFAAGSSKITTVGNATAADAELLADGDVLTLAGSHTTTVTLADGDLAAGAFTGNVTVVASSGSNVIATGSGNDVIGGGTGDDTIDGGTGGDTITGGAGADTITLGTGSDTVVLNSLTGADTVTDFTAAADKFSISKTLFSGLGALGTLGVAALESGSGLTSAATASGRLVYDTASGDLYYDADGSGGDAAVLIVTLTGAPVLLNTMFTIVT